MQLSTDQHWSKYYDTGSDFRIATSHEIDKILEYIDPEAPKTCLDIGCGTGQLTRELSKRGFECVGIDTSSRAIEIAQETKPVPSDQLTYLHFDVERDPMARLPNMPYGLVTCKLVYTFIKDKNVFLQNVMQVLAPNGAFVIVTPLPEDVPPRKKGIATSHEDMELLPRTFEQAALYKEVGMTYFIGRQKTN